MGAHTDRLLNLLGVKWRRPSMHATAVDRFADFCGTELAIQEKTSCVAASFGLHVNTKRRTYAGIRPYREGEFDLLVIHLPASHLHYGRLFYIIPASVSVHRGIMASVTTGHSGKQACLIYPPGTQGGRRRNEWANEFLVDIEDRAAAISSLKVLLSEARRHRLLTSARCVSRTDWPTDRATRRA